MRKNQDKKTRNHIWRKIRLMSLICYGVNFLLLFFPWIVVGDMRCNLFELPFKLKGGELDEAIAAGSGMFATDAGSLEAGIRLELFVFGVFFLFSMIYFLFTLFGKRSRFNIAAMALSLIAVVVNSSGFSIMAVCTDMILGIAFPGVFLLLPGMEFVIGKMMDVWEETKANTEASQKKAKQEKEERKERLFFEGKYSELFYQYVWKNFKSNWKDYILLLLCSVMVFTFIVIGFGLKGILGAESKYEGMDQLFGGLNSVLMNAVIPIGIISVIIIVILTFYYLRCRAKNYGIFLTLGMRKSTLQYFVAMEFLSLLLVTVAAGGVLGTGVLAVFSANSKALMGKHIGMSAVGVKSYLYSVGVLLLIYLIAFMATRDIFYDFHMGHATDLNAVKEKIPVRWRNGVLAFGLLLCLISVYRYRQLKNFENVYLLLLLFAGLYIALRCGIVSWLAGERKKRKYLKKLMIHNQLFHKSGTNTRYIFAMAVIQFCGLFYFSFQMISAVIAEEADVLYPYDLVCMANDTDEDILQRMESEYGVRRQEYPMVRISNYDSTERTEGVSEGKPPQGQHIGISESTYHALRTNLDPDYKREDLHLDPKGESVYIVHQQDKSIKAQPLDFYLTREHPLLHAGLPCVGITVELVKSEDMGYYFRNIEGEEIGSLTGTFRQGLRDNLVVFSDEYFEVAKELWKTTDIYFGTPIPEEEEKIPGVNIYQGPSRLVLINTDKDTLREMEPLLAEFKERHKEDEKYDLTVPCYYTKPDAIQRLRTERTMKITMNFLVLIVSFAVYLVLLGVKMATEADMTARRAEFLTCMGMREKERRRLVRKELLRYYYLFPTAIAAVLAVIFTIAVFLARQYTKADMLDYVKLMIPVWAAGLVCVGAAVWILVAAYVRKSERREAR